jgi:hypothetical protein
MQSTIYRVIDRQKDKGNQQICDQEVVPAFSIRRSASSGCEILGPSGTVIAWTVTQSWAAIIASLLEQSGAEIIEGGSHNGN